MPDNTWRRQRDVGHGDDHLSVAHVVFPPTVRDVVDPLVLVLQIGKSLVLARIPVVASGVLVVLATVETLDDPPVSRDLQL